MPENAHYAEQTDTHTAWQSFAITYEYPVSFTRDLFEPKNPVLLDTL